jgi:hypothetical protein
MGVGAALLGVSLGFTTAALAATRALGLDALAPELMAVTLANLVAAAFRFAILRTWIFRPRFGTHLGAADDPARPASLPDTPARLSAPFDSDRIPTRTTR